jgi:GTP cyclohydrolase III
MVAAGPYDKLLEAQKLHIESLAKREIEEIKQEYNTEITICTERNRARLEAETAANNALYNGIAMAQSKVISTAIEKWKKQELEKVEKDPSAYIKIN